MGGIFHTKAFDYGNMGGVPSRGAASAAQVDSGATFYRPAKTSKKDEKKKKKEEKEKAKVKQAVPQIGAIGAFAAMSGGLIGAATMAQGSPKAQRANLEKKSSADADQEKAKNEKKFKKSFSLVEGNDDDITPEVDSRKRRVSEKKSVDQEVSDDDDAAPTGKCPFSFHKIVLIQV